MPLRVGLLTAAHVHTMSYATGLVAHPDADLVGIWDDNSERGQSFAQRSGVAYVGFLEDLLGAVDAVVITCENTRHVELIEHAAREGKHILCEKPLATSEDHAARILNCVEETGVKFMTAFPCRFAPGYARLKQRVQAGDIGEIKAICATNRGRCPFLWFVQPELSGGGAMIDHVVHVADLLRDLLGEDPITISAQIGSNMYHQAWEDTAILSIEFPSGIFATLDSSWSRPQTYRTWGDVSMSVVGQDGVIEMDMFRQDLEYYHDGPVTHSAQGFGPDNDRAMIDEFVRACLDNREPRVTVMDGWKAAQVALAGYRSAREGQPVAF